MELRDAGTWQAYATYGDVSGVSDVNTEADNASYCDDRATGLKWHTFSETNELLDRF